MVEIQEQKRKELIKTIMKLRSSMMVHAEYSTEREHLLNYCDDLYYVISSLENVDSKLIWQERYCKMRTIPMLAPINGHCFSCRKLIQDSRETYITSCEHCNYSFCE